MIKGNPSALPQVLGALLLTGILAAIVALAWHGTLTGGEALGVISTIVAGALGAFAVHAGVQSGASAATLADPSAADPKATTKS